MQVPLVLAAVLPILLWVGGRRTSLAGGVVIVSWLIFLLDLAVNVRLVEGYLRSPRGRLDLGIILLTGPWILLPVFSQTGFLVAVRLARVARVFFVTRHARRLVEQLGRGFVVGVAIVFVCSDIAYHAERATNAEFETFTDSLWWAVVTICTVGYGDISPQTATGRWAGVVLMVTGIGIIGALAGSLAGFLRLAPTPAARQPPAGDDAGGSGPTAAPVDMTTEDIASLRSRLSALDAQLERLERGV